MTGTANHDPSSSTPVPRIAGIRAYAPVRTAESEQVGQVDRSACAPVSTDSLLPNKAHVETFESPLSVALTANTRQGLHGSIPWRAPFRSGSARLGRSQKDALPSCRGFHFCRFKARATLLKGWRLLRQWRTAVVRAARSTGLSPFSVRKRRPPDVPAQYSRAPSSPTCRSCSRPNSSSSSTCKRRGHSASPCRPRPLR